MTKDIDARLKAEIERFAANVTLILQDAVTDAITEALGAVSAAEVRKGQKRPKCGPKSPPVERTASDARPKTSTTWPGAF